MKIVLKDRTVEFPEQIYLDQLIQLDLDKLDKIQNADLKNLNESRDLLKWMLDFFKVIGIKERFTIEDLAMMQKDNQLQNWFERLFAGFQ